MGLSDPDFECPQCSALTEMPAVDICVCGRRVRTAPNMLGVQFYIGQSVRFFNKCGIDYGGIIRDITDREGEYTIMGYSESTWRSACYNEFHNISEIAVNSQVLGQMVVKSSRRRPPPRDPSPLKPAKASKKAVSKKGTSAPKKATAATEVTHQPFTPSLKSDHVVVYPRTVAIPAPTSLPPLKVPYSKPVASSSSTHRDHKRDIRRQKPVAIALPASPWIIDMLVSRGIGLDSEHDTCTFDPALRGNGSAPINSFERVEDLLCRVRFIEGCSMKLHRGVSRLDRSQQRALLHLIYENSKAGDHESQQDPRSFPAKAMNVRNQQAKGAQHTLRLVSLYSIRSEREVIIFEY